MSDGSAALIPAPILSSVIRTPVTNPAEPVKSALRGIHAEPIAVCKAPGAAPRRTVTELSIEFLNLARASVPVDVDNLARNTLPSDRWPPDDERKTKGLELSVLQRRRPGDENTRGTKELEVVPK
ncbi:hypothetical protein BS17DRAFT_817969 [Gyrodon lividus]|nr:hypothetical protein BS17DRAFT_817969 [Gyrodon lividus]